MSLLREALRQHDLIVSKRYAQWLMKHGDDPYPQWVVDIIAREMRKTPRKRVASFSASSAGTCWRRQELQYLGAPPTVVTMEARTQNILNDGSWRHLRWQANLLTAGIIHTIELPVVWRKMRSRGTMDGRGETDETHPNPNYAGQDFGLELKGVSGFQFPEVKRQGIKPEHQAQYNRYFVMSGVSLFVVVYEDKSTQDWFEWVIEQNERIMDEQRRELAALNDAIDKKHLHDPLPSCRARMGKEWTMCQFAGPDGTCERIDTWWQPKKRKT